MDANIILEQAIASLKVGRRAEARRLLESVLFSDPQNEQAWLWMSGAVDNDEERIICLENVLAINPYNQRARQGVASLRARSAIPRLTTSRLDLVGQPSLAPGRSSVLEQDLAPLVPEAPGRPRVADYRSFIAILILLAVLLICVVLSIITFIVLTG